VRRHVARMLTLTLLCVGLMSAARSSEAQTVCFKLDPYPDTLRIRLVAYPDSMYGAFVRWRTTSYQFQGTGLLSPDTTTTGDWRLTFWSAGNTGNFACDFQALIAAKTWQFQCPSTGFSNSGTFTYLPTCPSTAAPQDEGPTAMSPN
jgi:hypothetical protein